MSLFRLASALASATLLIVSASSARAEPTSGPVTILQLRPYVGGNTVYVYLNGTGPCGSGVAGAYAIYSLDVSTPSGKAAYAAALAALTMGKPVYVEAIATACGTQYPGVQSIYITN